MRMRKSLALLLGAAGRKRRSVHGLRGGGRNYERSRALSPNISNLFAQRAKLPAPPLFFCHTPSLMPLPGSKRPVQYGVRVSETLLLDGRRRAT